MWQINSNARAPLQRASTKDKMTWVNIGSISDAPVGSGLSSLGVSVGSFLEQRLVIEPTLKTG